MNGNQKDHILVCVSASPTNAKIIRNAANMAKSTKGAFTALYVETRSARRLSEEDKIRLHENTKLAQKLGATLEVVYGDNIAVQIAEYARVSGVTKVVVGRDPVSEKRIHFRPSLVDTLIQSAPGLDIYIIPDAENIQSQRNRLYFDKIELSLKDLFISCAILGAVTALGLLFRDWGFTESNIITIYILGALLISILTNSRSISLVISILSVVLFNFLFTEPRFTLKAYEPGYPVTFLVMFVATFITGTLAMKLKDSARQSARAAYRTQILFDANQEFSKVHGTTEIVQVMVRQLQKLYKKDVVVYLTEQKKLQEPLLYQIEDGVVTTIEPEDQEREVAQWTFENNKHAGATTENYSSAKYLYYAIRVNQNVYGVVGLAMEHNTREPFENSIFLSILGECALALENETNAREREKAALLAQKEQFRANLLRSISHDLRTPLTSISGNAGVLLSSNSMMKEEKREEIYQGIYDDSMWLIQLVENLLSVSRIEDGNMNLHMDPELLEEIVAESLKHVDHHSVEHTIVNQIQEEMTVVKADARLIVQVFINLLNNAIKYTPKESVIILSAQKQDQWVEISVEDNGAGIPDEQKTQIFDMFYTANSKVADGRRSLGMGLALCKSIVLAHGGEMKVEDGRLGGAAFRFTLPVEEVNLDE